MLVNVTVPVYNEEKALAYSVRTVHAFLSEKCRFDWEIVIADNASNDGTAELSGDLAEELEGVRVTRLEQKGRGRALSTVWSASAADILSYMDVDLSSNLYAFPPMIEALICGGFDVATGSRLLKGAMTQRSLKRELLSRCYNVLVKVFFRTRFSDAQCGFKALTRDASRRLLHLVEDTSWFFDTELLVLAEKSGLRIFDLPVNWVEDLESRVNIVPTAIDDIKGLIRVRRKFWNRSYPFQRS